MILTSFSYRESGWELRKISPFKDINLLVGRNATGKTRTIQAIKNVTGFLQMKGGTPAASFESEMEFQASADSKVIMKYGFKIANGKVEKEKFVANGHVLIKRTVEKTLYDNAPINPPADKLVVQIRRDKEQFQEIEQLMEWAEGVVSVSCSEINPMNAVTPEKTYNQYSLSSLVDRLSAADMEQILTLSAHFGYNISELSNIDASSNIRFVRIKESKVSGRITDSQLSSGMLRMLYLLCFLAVIKKGKMPSLLQIDDFGEGLDYRRSAELGRIVFDDCEKSGLQVIASSNDSFMMDVVDIANLQVLRRNGSKVQAINQSTHPELFRRFRMTGLSNFDLLSSDFIDQYLTDKK